MLHGHSQLCSQHKSRRHLLRHCERCCNKLWYFKLWIKKVIGLIKGKLGGKLMGEFDALRPKTFSYLTDDINENKKRKMCTLNLKIINVV